MKKKKNKGYSPSKWIYVIMFGLPLIFVILMTKKLDNDIWYLLAEGRYIVQNGIYHIDPLSIHQGLQVVVQNWLSASIFWCLYSAFGHMALVFLILICDFFICLLTYKICKLISDDNKILSLLVMTIGNLSLVAHFLVSRPQILSFILLLGVIYVLEKYIKTDNSKYLIWLPILSVIEANLHASLWLMIFLFALPYVIDSFKCNFLHLQGYRTKPLLIYLGIALVVSLINPYGYKVITFIFTSFTDKTMHSFINELLPFSFNSTLCKHMFIIMMIIGCLYAYIRNNNVRVRYICLFCGTLILGFISVKGFSHFLLVSFFPLAYLFKDIFPRDFSDVGGLVRKILNYFYMACGIIVIGLFGFLYVNIHTRDIFANDLKAAMDVMDKYADSETSTVYSSFNNGGYVEFRGYKAYIDPRAELYLKINNKKEDIFQEYYDLQRGAIDKYEFIEKYNFTHMLVSNGDVFYHYDEDEKNENYVIIYVDTNLGIKLYARKDLFKEDQLKTITEQYEKALAQAKAEANNTTDTNTNKNSD